MHWGAFGCANSAVAPRLADGAPGVGVLVGPRPTSTEKFIPPYLSGKAVYGTFTHSIILGDL